MAWMIKAGKMGRDAAGSAGTLSIVSAPEGPCTWRLVAAHPRHAAAADVWQGILDNLIQQENKNEQ